MALIIPKKQRANYFSIFLGGALILAGSVYILLLTLQHVYGRYEIADIMPAKDKLQLVNNLNQQSIAILHSKYTKGLFPRNSTWLMDNVRSWEKYIQAAGFSCEIISDKTIETGAHYQYKLIILPSAKALSEAEITQLKRYVENGGSVLATSSTASFTADGKWRGWSFFSEIFGIQFVKEVSSGKVKKYHTLRGGLPLTSGIPTGYSFKIGTWDNPMSCEVVESRTTEIGYWFDYRDENSMFEDELEKSTGIVSGEYGKGRFIWMGFELDSVVGEQDDYVNFYLLFRNFVNWLTHAPTVYINDWPAPYKAAAVITPILLEEASNASNLIDILREDEIPVSFFVDPEIAEMNPSLVKELARFGDLGVIVDLGFRSSFGNQPLQFYDFDNQLQNVTTAKSKLENLLNIDVLGAMPLFGAYDEHSVKALIDADYEYIFSDSLHTRAVPETQRREKDLLVSFPNTAIDDFQIIKKMGIADPELQMAMYMEDIDRVAFTGGLHVLKLHSNYQLLPENVNVVRSLASYIREKGMWLTSASEMKNWWASREALEVETKVITDRRFVMTISNSGSWEIKDFVVQINLNKPVSNLDITSDIIGTQIPNHSYQNETQTLQLKILNLPAGQTIYYFVDYDNVNIQS